MTLCRSSSKKCTSGHFAEIAYWSRKLLYSSFRMFLISGLECICTSTEALEYFAREIELLLTTREASERGVYSTYSKVLK